MGRTGRRDDSAPVGGGSPRAGARGKRWWPRERLALLCIPVLAAVVLLFGGGNVREGNGAQTSFKEANALFNRGEYAAALSSYGQLLELYPDERDRVLFEMGILHSHPGNGQRDYQKSLECFQQLIREYPRSPYRRDSEMMVFSIHNVALKDRTISAQQARIESLRQELRQRDEDNAALREKLRSLERMTMEFAVRKRSVDRILIEKRERRLTLLSKDEVFKSYRIALGGNPDGPKEQEGDNKTPEGCYVIDAKNGKSSYHLALHISYPNEHDRMRAKQRGVPPGGNIMIHGLKNGFSWVGDSHTDTDWTKGCIAVTDEEIEELYRLVPVGTAVEIRP